MDLKPGTTIRISIRVLQVTNTYTNTAKLLPVYSLTLSLLVFESICTSVLDTHLLLEQL
jgi:hypothetical protein